MTDSSELSVLTLEWELSDPAVELHVYYSYLEHIEETFQNRDYSAWQTLKQILGVL